MIVCHCQLISDHDINAAIDWMRCADEAAIITPGKIYHALGKSPECGGCMKLFVVKMRANTNLEVPAELRGLRSEQARRSIGHEGRSKGNRVSQQSAAS
ncbi:(2Fe-2S)-binding protein [uncultured Shimia sp.]|uniref:(2Fe-2S)-binding protein n=1 Tax=uncultured Shimia sp. TaxID=573152 RepID=UPI0025FE80CD|nr:(2Fe-2S)-binding protein [uncultured Shimia sp.]